MPFDPLRPFNQLSRLPPAALLESRTVLKACIEARARVAELRQACALIPNPAVLVNTVPLLETQASSAIENIVTSADELFRVAAEVEGAGADDPAAREAFRYRAALGRGMASLTERPVSTRTAVEVCGVVLNQEVEIRRVPGTALRNAATGQVIYTPPEGEGLLRDLLANWERFLHEERQLDPLVRMAVGHYQFEAIHPFADGNGRTGRILNLLFLIEQGLLDLPVLYLSRFIVRRKADYYRLLLEVTLGTEGAWEAWLLYLLAAVEETARWTTDRIGRIRVLMADTARWMRQEAAGAYRHELAELIFVQPYCRIRHVVDAGLAQRQTATLHLRQLAAAGILEETRSGRELLFINTRLMRLLVEDEPGDLSFGKDPA